MGRRRTPEPAGLRFGRWTVLQRLPATAQYSFHWRVRCDCGTETIVYAPNLKRGLSKSCGCLHREAAALRRRTHGLTDTPEYEIWCGIKKRCYNPKNRAYPRYGGRGITVCARWRNSFSAFLTDIGPRPSPDHSIDRKDNDGHYEPNNCRWATALEQRHNRPEARPFHRCDNVWIEHDGVRLTATEWDRRLGFRVQTVNNRLRLGWTAARALTQPLRKHPHR